MESNQEERVNKDSSFALIKLILFYFNLVWNKINQEERGVKSRNFSFALIKLI